MVQDEIFDSVDSRLAETGGADVDSLVAMYLAQTMSTGDL